jgi:amidohydrolase
MNQVIKNLINSKKDEIFSIYHALHQIPELAMEEIKTASYLENYLTDHGFVVQSGVGKTGLVTYVNSGFPGPLLGIRADMDALAHVIDGNTINIHSCGHDAHMTMALFAGIIAKELGLVKTGGLKLIFQPAEEDENLGGARAMISDGVVDDLDFCVGLHLRPIHEAKLGEVAPALWHGALTTIAASITGETAHGARPHLGINVSDALAAIVFATNSIRVNPMLPTSVKVTYLLAGGGSFSSIPDHGEIAMDLRSASNDAMEELKIKTLHAINTGADTIGCSTQITRMAGYPAAVYNKEMIDIAKTAIEEMLGPQAVLGEITTPGAEDFHEFVKAKPTLKTTYLGIGCNLQPGLHHPKMTFEKKAMLNGIMVLSSMINRILG